MLCCSMSVVSKRLQDTDFARTCALQDLWHHLKVTPPHYDSYEAACAAVAEMEAAEAAAAASGLAPIDEESDGEGEGGAGSDGGSEGEGHDGDSVGEGEAEDDDDGARWVVPRAGVCLCGGGGGTMSS